MAKPRGEARNSGGWERALRYSTAGIELALSVVIGYWFGHWLDGKLGTDPWLMISFLIIGTVAGMRSLYRTAKRALEEQSASSNDDGERPPGGPGEG